MSAHLMASLMLFGLTCSLLSSVQSQPLLHISIEPEYLFRYKENFYIRFYQTVLNPIDVSQTEFLKNYDGKSKVYKDIWKDTYGRIIIMPGLNQNKNIGIDKTNWFGVGDYRNQIKFMYNYKNQGASTPLIHSFLVDYDAVQLFLAPTHVTDEKHKRPGLSVNVDKFLPNQFSISELDMEVIRRNILADSLVTYAFNPDEIPQKPAHWGEVLGIEELFHRLSINDEVPGIQRDRSSRQNIKKALKELSNIKDKSPEFKANSKKIYEMYKNSMYDVKEGQMGDNAMVEKLRERFAESLNLDKQQSRASWLKDITDDLSDLHAMKVKLKELEAKPNKDFIIDNRINELKSEIRSKISDYNSKYMPVTKEMYHLKESVDVDIIDAWIKESRKRMNLNARVYEGDSSSTYYNVKSKKEFQLAHVQMLENDDMFSKAGRDIREMPELKELSKRFRKEYVKAKSFFTGVEAFCIKLQGIISDEKVYGPLKGLTPEKLFKQVFKDDPLFVAKLESGFFQEGLDSQKYMSKITENFAKNIRSTDVRQHLRNEMETFMTDIMKHRKHPKYTTEVILQYGETPQVAQASTYLKNRHILDEKTVVHLYYQDGLYKSTQGNWNDLQLNEKTRITVVGHGMSTSGELHIGGKNAVALANDILNNVIINDDLKEITLGKISLVACNENDRMFQGGMDYGRELIRKLDSENIDSVVSVRNGKVEVTVKGMKVYGEGTDLHWRKQPPLIYRKRDNGLWDYGVVDVTKGSINWTPKRPYLPGTEKILIVSKNLGPSFEYEMKQQKLVSIEDMSGKTSGPLDFNDQKIMVASEFGNLNEQSKMYLDSDFESPKIIALLDDSGLQSGMLQLEAKDTVDRLSVATSEAIDLISDSNSENWVPIIDTAERDSNGITKVTMMDTDTLQTQEVHIKNDAFIQFKTKSKKPTISVDSLPKFSKSSIGMAGAGGFLGLGGFIYSAIQMSRAKQCKENVTCPATKEARQLAKALEINAYVSMAEGSFGVVTDSVQIAELAVSFKLSKNAVNGIATMSKTTSNFLKVSKVLGKIGTGVGAVGSVVSLGFSSYQLHHAQTKAQKIEYGIQVGIDSLNLAVTGVAIGTAIAATMTTSATVAAIASAAGPVGFVVAIVGILATTITSLAFEFKNTRKNADLVGEYFWKLDNAYSKYGIEYNSSSDTLRILDHAIIKELDFERRRIVLDSQYIYRTWHGRTGSGKINYFFWYKDFPKMIEDKSKAINIRHGIGWTTNVIYKNYIINTKQLILPAIPKSYISYEYNRLPGCTTMRDKGFNVARRLERDYRFDYDFYIIPGEQIVSSISHEYVKTRVTVKLSSNIKVIVSQKIPDSLQNKYTFHLITKSPRHTLLVSDGYAYVLDSSSQCSWNIDCDTDFDDIEFPVQGTARFGKSDVTVMNERDYLFVFDKMGGIMRIDAHAKQKQFVSVVHNRETTPEELKRYLRNSKTWLKGQKYIIVRNFANHGTFIGKAFYDVESDNLLFSHYERAMVSEKFKENVQLLGRYRNDVYFMSEEDNEGDNDVIVWRTDVTSKQIKATYNLYCGKTGFQITKLNMQEHAVLLIQNVFNVSLVYMIYPEEIQLIYIDGKIDDIQKLGDACFPTLNTFLPRTQKQTAGQFPGKCLYAGTIPIMPIKETISNGVNKHYWLYMKESHPPEYNYDTIFCEPNKPPVATGIIKPNITDECDDLSLRDIPFLHSGEEVYYFMCEKDKILYYQKGSNHATEIFVPGKIDRIEEYGNVKLIKSHNGGIYKFTEYGNFSLMAFSFEHITNDKEWIQSFKSIAEKALVESFIPVLHLQNVDQKSITAWFDVSYERLVIVSPIFDAQDITYIGPSPSSYLVWLFSESKQQVMLQSVLRDEDILQGTVMRNNNPIWGERRLPIGKVVLNNVNSVEYMQGGVFAVKNDGVMVHADHFQAIKLLGVNSTWLSKNKVSLGNSLSELCNRYQSSSIIALGEEEVDKNKVIHRWYHCDIQSQIALPVQRDNDPSYLGISKSDKLVYFTVGDKLIKVDTSSTKMQSQNNVSSKDSVLDIVCNILMAEVRGNTLLLKPANSDLLADIPMLDNVLSLLLGMDYGLEVILEADHWLHYESIVVTHIGSSGPQISYLTIHPPHHCSYEFEQIENTTVISDPISNRKIVLDDFTKQAGKINEDYLPIGNEAVINVQICDHDPVTFVSNQERPNPPIALKSVQEIKDSQSLGFLVINGFSVAVIFIIVVVSLFCFLAVLAYRKARNSRQQIVSARDNIRVNEPPMENEVAL